MPSRLPARRMLSSLSDPICRFATTGCSGRQPTSAPLAPGFPELTLAQIKQLGDVRPLELGLTVIGNQEVMTCEHCLLMAKGPCVQSCDGCARRKGAHVLRDRKGYEFPVVTDQLGRSHLYNAVQLDIVPDIPQLLASGVTAFLIDSTLMNGEETAQAVGRVKRALNVAQADGNSLAKMPNTTSGHLHRGVS